MVCEIPADLTSSATSHADHHQTVELAEKGTFSDDVNFLLFRVFVDDVEVNDNASSRFAVV